jgi:L,D-transpeptidase YcbB
MKFFTLYLFISTCIFLSCKQQQNNTSVTEPPVTIAESVTQLFMDSSRLENFIAGNKVPDSTAQYLRRFYRGRNYQFAWFNNDGMAAYTSTFYNMYTEYAAYAADSAAIFNTLPALFDSLSTVTAFTKNDSLAAAADLLLTLQFFRYARRAYTGNPQLDTKELEWFIPRKKINLSQLLDSMLAAKGKDLTAYEPVNRQYHLLKEYLVKYYAIEKQGGWQPITINNTKMIYGDTASGLLQLKQRLFLTGDLAVADTTGVYNETTAAAIKKFQHRYGFKEDGKISNSLLAELNRPVSERIQQLLINMERIRWVPATPNGTYLLVNIPEYKLHIYEQGAYAFNMNVVVGTAANSTVIFNGNLKHVVFSPYWNVPPGILKNEVLPAIKRNPNYLAKHNMEWNGGAVRQKPGPSNALGLVKFLFPNSYNIYLHDSPAKSLFNESKRAFSHGCIRVAEPKKLARFLLKDYPQWTDEKITTAMNAGKEQYFNLKQTVPVFIGYFTAWVDRDGLLNFRNDVYGHDKKMAQRLFSAAKQ